MNTADLLLAAATEIRDRGLAKGDFTDTIEDWEDLNACPVCTVGAIDVAAGGEPDEWYRETAVPAILAFADYLGLNYTQNCDDECVYGQQCEECGPGNAMLAIGRWNDADERTWDDVVTALEAAAASLVTT